MSGSTVEGSTARRASRSFLPVRLVRSLYQHRDLIRQLAHRDIANRYKGSFLGVFWAVVTPLIMLGVYAFVFSVIFGARWGLPHESKLDFALTLFAGLLVFNVFADTIGRASTLVTGNPSYVKRVVFPLEILPVVALYAAMIQGAFSLVILLLAWLGVHHTVSTTIWLFPVVLVPLCFLALGSSWILASLGVFIRDIQHPVAILVQVLVFMSGIFFPLTALPYNYAWILLHVNPLVPIIEDARRTLIWGRMPDWKMWAFTTITSFVLMLFGYWWFMRSRKAFADVV